MCGEHGQSTLGSIEREDGDKRPAPEDTTRVARPGRTAAETADVAPVAPAQQVLRCIHAAERVGECDGGNRFGHLFALARTSRCRSVVTFRINCM